MNNTAKVLALLFLAAGAGFLFRAVDYHSSTVLKGPIRLTFFTKKRFVVAGDRYLTFMDGEVNCPSTERNISLSTIDIKSFRELTPNNSAGTNFLDKNFTYYIHHGEDPYMMRNCEPEN